MCYHFLHKMQLIGGKRIMSDNIQEKSQSVVDAVDVVSKLERLEQLEVTLEVMRRLFHSEELFPVVSKLIESPLKLGLEEEVRVMMDCLNKLAR